MLYRWQFCRLWTPFDQKRRNMRVILATRGPNLSITLERNLGAKLPEHCRSVLPSLHVADDFLFLDERLVMPAGLQKPITALLHATHADARAMLPMAEFLWFHHKVRAFHSMARTCPSRTATGKNLTVVSVKAALPPGN